MPSRGVSVLPLCNLGAEEEKMLQGPECRESSGGEGQILDLIVAKGSRILLGIHIRTPRSHEMGEVQDSFG